MSGQRTPPAGPPPIGYLRYFEASPEKIWHPTIESIKLYLASRPNDRRPRITVAGSRRRNSSADCQMLRDLLDTWDAAAVRKGLGGLVIVSGACQNSADEWAEQWAEQSGTAHIILPARWTWLEAPGAVIKTRRDGTQYNAKAGFDRNGPMVELGIALIALVARDRTGGTEDTVRKALAAGKRVYLK